jgi:hypothetical protein
MLGLRIALVFVLGLALAGCDSSRPVAKPPTAGTSKGTSAANSGASGLDEVASVCRTTAKELNTIYEHTVGQTDPEEFGPNLRKLTVESLPVIEAALGKIRVIKVAPRLDSQLTESLTNLEHGRDNIQALRRTVAQARGANRAAFPRGLLRKLVVVGSACRRPRTPVNG